MENNAKEPKERQTPLLPLVRNYFKDYPTAAAHALETMSSEEAVTVLSSLPPSMVATALNYLNDAYAAVLLEKIPPSTFKHIGNRLDAQKTANILLRFSGEMRKSLLNILDEKQRRQIQELLDFPERSAGRVMSMNFVAFHSDIRVRDAIDKIRRMAKKGAALSYIYVIDTENRLVGILNMRDMLLADSSALLEHIMRKDIFSVNCMEEVENITNAFLDRKFFAVPVVDSENRLLGVIRAEHVIGDVQDAATEDIQKMFGAGGDERAFSPLSRSFKTRLPWLHVNLATAFMAAYVVSLFEGIIAKITILAVYLPVVAGQGGNAGAQSLAIVMRSLVMREVPPHKVKKLLLKETYIGAVNGIVIGIVTALIAWLWQGNPFLGVVVGLGMIVNLTVAGLSGALIPVTMKALRLDPAQCSSIILTTITDVMGFFAFLGFAVLFQNFLV